MNDGISRRTLYRIDSFRVSLEEYWWGVRSPAIVIAALLKVLRVRLPSSTDDPNVEALGPFEPAAGEDASVLEPYEALTEDLTSLGFHSPIVHRIVDDLHKTETTLVTFAHESGTAFARIHDRIWRFHTPSRRSLFVEFVTGFKDGGFLWSLSSKPDLKAPPQCRVIRKVGAPPAELWRAHREALGEIGPARAKEAASAPEELRAALERHHATVRQFHRTRGIFAPLTEAESKTLAGNQAGREAAEADGSAYPEVLAQIRSIEASKSNSTTGLIILVVSLALFAGAGGVMGGGGSSLKDLAILIPVLFFHEAGHWLAMRFFGYRNLRMFFIPFLGAAVSGRHYNVPGWKKAVVSLMGPLPGIFLGAILASIGLVTHNSLLMQIALTLLLLNGLNLLPLLPFDGGWVVQAIFASRQMFFEVAFRVFAVVTLLGLGFWAQDRVLQFIAFIMIISLPASYKVARVTRDLRRSALEPASPDDQAIPTPVAEAIVARVVEAFPGVPSKQTAEHTLQIFEALNARPPGVLAAIGIGLVQGAGLLAALVFSVLVFLGRSADLPSLLRMAAEPPKYTLNTSELVVPSESAESPVLQAPHSTLISTLGSAAEAASVMAEVGQEAPNAFAIAGLERTVLLALPQADDSGRRRFLEVLKREGADLFVATPEQPAQFRLQCLAPTGPKAESIEQDMSDYFQGSHLKLIPPWSDSDTRTPEERATHSRGRRTFARLQQVGPLVQDPRPVKLAERIQAASRTGDSAEMKRLREERQRLSGDLREAALVKLRSEVGLEPLVVDRFLELGSEPGDVEDAERASAALGPLLGNIRTEGDGDPSNQALTGQGYVQREGLLLNMHFFGFGSSFTGPIATIRWLQLKGCGDFRYEFSPGFAVDEFDEEADPG